MIEKIYFDWYNGDEYNKSFGQITYVDKYDEKIAVHNFDNVEEEEFKTMFKIYKTNNTEKTYAEYGHMF